MRHGPGLVFRHDDGPDVGTVAAVSGPGSQSFCPHLLVGQAMSTDDDGAGEIVREITHVSDACQFKVHNGNLGTVLGDSAAQVFKVASNLHHTKMMVQRLGKKLRITGIPVGDNNVERLHQAAIPSNAAAKAVRFCLGSL